MKRHFFTLTLMVILLVSGVDEASSQERPKLREISDRKYEIALNGVVPCEKKEECGYADHQGKFIIPPIFHKVMPMSDRHVGFVCFLDELGKECWTPISLKGLYLTDLNFSKVVEDFDDRGLSVVRQGEKYGIINHTGKMVAGCSYRHFQNKGPVYLLYNESKGCVAVAKDNSEKGYTSYSFASDEPVIVRTERGYGIISPMNYFVVADFIYDSVKEVITWEAYVLQKDVKKYLYAADKLSMGYDDIILGHGQAYFAVRNNGKWGVVTKENEVLLSCSQDEVPMLKRNEYACFYENGSPVYLTVNRRASASEYDDYLYSVKHKGSPAEYLLDETLALESKKKVSESVSACYGTKNFDLLKQLDVANEYAESRKFILLSRNNENAMLFDQETGKLRDAGAVLYHAFPSKTGAPAYATTLQYGKFGIMDIRNSSLYLPAEYDKIIPVNSEYAALQKEDSLYLYHVNDNLMITCHGCESMDDSLLAWDILVMKQNGKDRFYNVAAHKWTLPDDHSYVRLVSLSLKEHMPFEVGAFMKKGAKGAIFDLKTGERLTEYLFDDIEERLYAGKYLIVISAGKKGLYDMEAQRYVVPCEYSNFLKYDVFKENEYSVVTKAGKQGVYNLTKNKVVVAPLNDEVDIRDGYAGIRRSGKYAVFSLEHNKMVFDSPVEYVELMNDGYALLQGPGICEKGVYNLNWNEWYIDPVPGHDMCFLGGDYVGVDNRGVGNYKTNKLLLEIDDVYFDAFFRVERDFVVMEDPVEGASMWLYKLDDPDYYLLASSIDILPENFIPGCTLAIVVDYEYNDCWEITNVNHCQLRNLEGDVILNDSHDGVKFMAMDGLDFGLVRVSMENGEEWLFDAFVNEWILKSKGKMDLKRSGKYMQIGLPNDRVYLFDPHNSRVLVELKDAFTLQDLKASMEILSGDKYQTEYDGSKWLLRQAYKDNVIATGCDRISLMYK